MKTILTFFIFLFSFPVIADDIADFQIEGISIGDSLLEYMSSEDIIKEIKSNKNRYSFLEDSNRFGEIFKWDGLKTYDVLSFLVKPEDKKFLIYDITGSIEFTNDFIGCKKKQNEIVEEISKLFTNVKKDEGTYNHRGDPTNRSIVDYVRFQFDSRDYVLIQCMDYEESLRIKEKYMEDLSVGITTYEVHKWFRP
tara:strand:- start:293 stop:877 length:585 start_codon:yes stop_codon:yes gene_type:complete